MHLISYVYLLTNKVELLDKRDINTRQHEGKLFVIPEKNHFKRVQDPQYRASVAWNQLSVQIRNVTTKKQLVTSLKSKIVSPYMKIY